MKNILSKLLIINILFNLPQILTGQTTNDLINLLIEKQLITQDQADSMRADYSIKQQSALPDKSLVIGMEFRPRTEFRNGYQMLRNDTTVPSFFTNQRTRLSLLYIQENTLTAYVNLQDLRVWGQQDPKSNAATIQVFEAWAEPFFQPELSLRVGRQRLIFDNQRLFAENDWRMCGAAFDAANLRYFHENISSELAVAFNQSKENYFGTDYKPNNFTNFKILAVSYIKYKLSQKVQLSFLNSMDGFQASTNTEKIFTRYTNGGRLEYESGPWYATISGYYQWGKNPAGKDLTAWYLQPEVRLTLPIHLTVRAGGELFSGTDPEYTGDKDHSFVPLYGSGHSFNGSMDLITKFPSDIKNGGLFNPYLFLAQTLTKHLDLRCNFHSFSLMYDYPVDSVTSDAFLGFENDWLLGYKPSNFMKVELGFSYFLPTRTFAAIKGGDGDLGLTWAYLMLSLKPQIFSTKFK